MTPAPTSSPAQGGELKPCPFCGFSGKVEPDANYQWWHVECNGCGVQTDGCRSEGQAAYIWNRRSTPDSGEREDKSNSSAAGAGPFAQWQPITAEHEKSGRKFLVTNNLDALDAHGDSSHVWLSFVIKASDPERTGDWVGYDEGDRIIENLTHCMSVPGTQGVEDGKERAQSEPVPNQSPRGERDRALEEVLSKLPGGNLCDPQEIADMVRALKSSPSQEQKG